MKADEKRNKNKDNSSIIHHIDNISYIYDNYKTANDETVILETKRAEIFQNVNSSIYAKVTKYIVYGTHFNLEGTIEIPSISGISVSKVEVIIENLEQDEIVLTSDYSYSSETISFSTIEKINDGLNLEELKQSNYYILVKVTFSNNETNYYSLQNDTDYEDITYYTITKDNSNNKVYINFNEYNDIQYMELAVSEVEELPDDVYDIVIDPGHGGSDLGSESDGYNEAEIVLEYGLALQEKLEEMGYKVLITRDVSQSSSEDTTTNMYDDDGRVTIANESQAKLLISIHFDSNMYNLSSGGIEVYAPCNCNLDFAKTLADNLVSTAGASYSPFTLYKEDDGVYVQNFTEYNIQVQEEVAIRNGYEPYNITTSTPYLYIIRETGGIATNAYVDGRNSTYSANKYYDSNVGIESYFLELGYIDIDSDLENVLENKDLYIQAIADSIEEFF